MPTPESVDALIDPSPKVRHATGANGQTPDSGLARQLAEMARTMHAEPNMIGILEQITASTVAEIDHADYAGISLILKDKVETQAATHPLVARIDEQQYRLQEGPCLNSLRRDCTVRSDDLLDEPRWPEFAQAVATFGVRSMLAVQLFVEDKNLGALNIFSTEPHAFTEHDESTAMLLAAHAALAMIGRRTESNLRTALESRDSIGQAKGILMERYKINELEAFRLLVFASQHNHLKLRDVAESLAATGELPTA